MRLPDNENKREQLLSHIVWFVPAAAKIPGVRRVALLGSLMTEKKNPKDIDFLVTVDEEAALEPLARLGRKAKGRAQGMNRGADIFLADVTGKYIGRICSWSDCGPRIRTKCDALNCGVRHYLHDDLDAITLSSQSMGRALELWPVLERRRGLPDDLERVVMRLSESN